MSEEHPGERLVRLQCPIPLQDYPSVLLAHGGGGRLTQMLIEKLFLPSFRNPALEALHDGALLEVEDGRLAFSTDSFVISPLFFPGGDIGSLAVHGTVNDLAMCGATPLALSVGLILEEGLPMEDLWRIVSSMREAAETVGAPIVTGDTKVVDRGKGDGAFVNVTGIGRIPGGVELSPERVRPGDRILVNGTIADHGVAILSVREGLEFETALTSDSAPLHELMARALEAGGSGLHVARDPTRGGVASVLHEIAGQAGVGIVLEEALLPYRDAVRGACEILGLDPLYVANEGKCLLFVSPESEEKVLRTIRAHPLGRDAAVIGEVVAGHPGQVHMRSAIGGTRVVDLLVGEPLPRIC